jgi:hypothetical protein
MPTLRKPVLTVILAQVMNHIHVLRREDLLDLLLRHLHPHHVCGKSVAPIESDRRVIIILQGRRSDTG